MTQQTEREHIYSFIFTCDNCGDTVDTARAINPYIGRCTECGGHTSVTKIREDYKTITPADLHEHLLRGE